MFNITALTLSLPPPPIIPQETNASYACSRPENAVDSECVIDGLVIDRLKLHFIFEILTSILIDLVETRNFIISFLKFKMEHANEFQVHLFQSLLSLTILFCSASVRALGIDTDVDIYCSIDPNNPQPYYGTSDFSSYEKGDDFVSVTVCAEEDQ